MKCTLYHWFDGVAISTNSTLVCSCNWGLWSIQHCIIYLECEVKKAWYVTTGFSWSLDITMCHTSHATCSKQFTFWTSDVMMTQLTQLWLWLYDFNCSNIKTALTVWLSFLADQAAWSGMGTGPPMSSEESDLHVKRRRTSIQTSDKLCGKSATFTITLRLIQSRHIYTITYIMHLVDDYIYCFSLPWSNIETLAVGRVFFIW